MKIPHRKQAVQAMTMLELFVVIAVVGGMLVLLAAVLLPVHHHKSIGCINNQKQLLLAYKMWAGDNGDRSPMQVSTNNGGTLEIFQLGVASTYRVMSNELNDPRILCCPNDKGRQAAIDFKSLTDSNTSYFMNVDAEMTNLPGRFLSGDRNLEVNGMLCGSGLVNIRSNQIVRWTAGIHPHGGNIGLPDGSVQGVNNSMIQRAFQSDGLTNHWLVFP